MAEWSIAAVLKTVEGYTSGGSNPSFSAQHEPRFSRGFVFSGNRRLERPSRYKKRLTEKANT